MKRMEMRDITVGEYQFKVRPFGAKDATYIFGDVAAIILPILGTVSVASDDKDAVNMEMFDGMDMDKDSLVKALARINGNALSKLVSGSGRTSNGKSPTGAQASSGGAAASRNAASAFISGGRPVSITTASQRPIAQTTNTKNITVKQENRQSYTFNVSDRNAASKLQSEIHSQSGQSTDDLARALKYGR